MPEYTPDRWTTKIEPVGTPSVDPALLEPRLLPVAELHKRLTELRPACNAVLEAMRKRVQQGELAEDFCVNWADLSCMRAEVYLDDEGHAGYRVLIEEADPKNPEFQIAVTRELEARGFSDVYVETAW